MSPIISIFIGGLFLTAGDIVFKQWATHLTWLPYLAGLALYIIGMLFLVRTYSTENIAVATVLFVIFNIVTLVLVSWLYFKEPVTLLQGLGILLAFGVILLLR
jgi:multidrug transporter EmrE-like cation transporter